LDVAGTHGEPSGKAYDPPIDLSGATGLRFGCEYDNPRNEEVRWGFGDQEMCEGLGFVDSKVQFESTIDTAHSARTEGNMQLFTRDCATFGLKTDTSDPGPSPHD